MLSPKDMIKTPAPHRDRLSAFFGAFELSATSACRESEAKAARLIVAATPDGTPDRVILCARGASDSHHQEAILATASVDFGGATNPLMNALPDTFSVCLVDAPDLRAIITVFVQEMLFERCGRQAAIDGLCRVIVLMMLRRAIEIGTTGPDLLAGLSHPLLHRALVAIHDDPSRAWRIEQLAEISGLSRSRFMTLFRKVVGTTPGAYLTAWRLVLGRRALARGVRVKSAARLVGFGSAAAFSRAYSRAYGAAPESFRGQTQRAGPQAAGGHSAPDHGDR
jgi:AraC-like DNA-binding protein